MAPIPEPSDTELATLAAASPVRVEELEVRPENVAEDPPDAPILRAVHEALLERIQDEDWIELMEQFDSVSQAYSLGWLDACAKFRELANGSTFEVHLIEGVTSGSAD